MSEGVRSAAPHAPIEIVTRPLGPLAARPRTTGPSAASQDGLSRIARNRNAESDVLHRTYLFRTDRHASKYSAIRRWDVTYVQLRSVVGAGYRVTIGIAGMRGHRLRAGHGAGRPDWAFCT